MRRLTLFTLLAPAALLATVSCTPQQVRLWQDWHADDPAAAEAFVADGCARMCDGDWVDVTTDEEIFNEPVEAWGQCAEWMDDALAAGWSSSDWPTVDRIMYAESRCNPDAYNGETHFGGNASGLMQIIWPTWSVECGDGDIFDAGFNLRCALYLKTTYGWSQWSTY